MSDQPPPLSRCEITEICQYDRSCPIYAGWGMNSCRHTEPQDSRQGGEGGTG